MLRNVILIVLISAVSSFTFASKNNEISYDKIPTNIATGLDKYKCRGKFSKPDLFVDIGYNDKDIEKAVTCRMADFDGNGSLDYWIYKCNPTLTSCKSKVILIEKGLIYKVVDITRNLDGPDVFYVNQKKDFNYLEKFGCDLPRKDALMELGDGEGRENRIYTLDIKKNIFTEFSHCTTVEGAD